MIRRHTISIKNAWNGLKWALSTQPNFAVHTILSCISLIAGFIFSISYYEFLIILVLIFVGFTVEVINTAIEETTDAIDEKWREDIKLSKDIAAGAMLMFSIGAACIASIIFVPKLLVFIGLKF